MHFGEFIVYDQQKNSLLWMHKAGIRLRESVPAALISPLYLLRSPRDRDQDHLVAVSINVIQ